MTILDHDRTSGRSARAGIASWASWTSWAGPVVARIAMLGAMIVAMNGTWVAAAHASPVQPPTTRGNASTTSAATEPSDDVRPSKKSTNLSGKLNLNTASEQQLMVLPTVGPAKADRVVAWRKKNGGFKRIADLRRVKGFGYKTFKRLEPYLDIRGDTTLVAK